MSVNHSGTIARMFAERTSRRRALRRLGGGGLVVAALSSADHGAGAPASPTTTMQSGTLSEFAYPLEGSEPLQLDGGLVRVATAHEFPVLADMAIRSEQLDVGALQAPHWHPNAGEVHYVVTGQGSAGVVSPGGQHAIFDLRPGSVTFFPKGHYHYVHSTGAEPLRVLAAYTHEEPTTFNAGEVIGIVPRSILAQVLGVAESEFPDLPAPASLPVVPLGAMVEAPPDAETAAPADLEPYTLNLDGLEPVVYEGGTVTNVRGAELARLDGICFLPLYVEAGGVREPHWHPNAAELIYITSGTAECGLVGPNGLLEVFEIGPGDIAYFPTNWFHYVASIGSEPLDSIVYLSHAAPQRIDLSDAVGFLPLAVTAAGVGLEASDLDALPQRAGVVVAAPTGN